MADTVQFPLKLYGIAVGVVVPGGVVEEVLEDDEPQASRAASGNSRRKRGPESMAEWYAGEPCGAKGIVAACAVVLLAVEKAL